ncbi:hypothetical protein, partial [Actinomyces ruminis]|uniref:hypothetical protein n=1 Tax=Actinomyces ruminis TaxID=1937003 RepID=UPI00117737C8
MTWKTPSLMPPGWELGPTSAQVARRERLAASSTSSQRARIISASAEPGCVGELGRRSGAPGRVPCSGAAGAAVWAAGGSWE